MSAAHTRRGEGATGERNRSVPGRGIARQGRGLERGLMRRIVISFDDETFEQVRSRAVNSGRSFNAEVRELVEFGLADLEGE